jgi:hypothetical protein
MSFLDRSVPLKYAILSAIAIAVFTGVSVHELHNRSNEISRYGPALPAEVVRVDEPKSVGGIFGLWSSTYTNTEVKVTPRSGQPWYYRDISLKGSVDVGDELKAWFYDDNPDSTSFENRFYPSDKESEKYPWPSVEDQFGIAFVFTLFATIVASAFLILLPKKLRKRKRPARSRRESEAA